MLQDAIDVLTEAARRRVFWSLPLEGMPGTPSTQSAPADWAEFVTLALVGAAANIGGIDATSSPAA